MKSISLIFLFFLFCGVSIFATPQGKEEVKWQQAINLYAQGDFLSALSTFTGFSQDPEIKDKGRTYLWLAKTFLVLGDSRNATQNIEHFLTNYSLHPLISEGKYTKARVLFAQNDYEAAIKAFYNFLLLYPESEQVPNALFWLAESSYSLGLLKEAKSLYTRLVTGYPSSFKYDAAQYRLGLIEIKGRESELLKLLKWSHEDSLQNKEEFERREKAFLQAIQSYQKRLSGTPGSETDSRIKQLETLLRQRESELEQLRGSNGQGQTRVSSTAGSSDQITQQRTLDLKEKALSLKETYLNWMVTNAQK